MSEAKKSVVEQVKELLNFSEEQPQKFMEVKTSEGVILNISEMEAGASVSIISEDGENPAPVGEYILEDGSVVVVGEEGVVSEVKAAEEDVEEEMSEEVVEEVVEEVNPLEARLDALEEAVNQKFESIVNDISEKFKSVIDLQAKELDELNAKFSAFKSEPAKEEIKLSKAEIKANKFKTIGEFRRKK